MISELKLQPNPNLAQSLTLSLLLIFISREKYQQLYSLLVFNIKVWHTIKKYYEVEEQEKLINNQEKIVNRRPTDKPDIGVQIKTLR